ncbi:hypothetical protein BHE74_00002546 [Ensete ventricosum]|nr:hypothetical protein GW17_00044458 [Ensete ventricosum]RWW88576.1 hypothetical protein BHE74_00002546 [Ensete ventricosum]RZR76800.1 hypothetical protein BHM03_00001682 [Ensete ventricosum]
MSSAVENHQRGEETAADRDELRALEHFAKFFECWLAEQERDLQVLRTAAASASEELRLRPLVDRVLGHYEYYYRAKAASLRRHVFPMCSPTWKSSTENLFLWAGGWRATMAFHLLYSKSGLQLEPRLLELVCGNPTRDLADLSLDQLERIDGLHRQTVRLEKEISEEEAQVQESVADARMVELTHALAESEEVEADAMEQEMKKKRDRMNQVLQRADQLRLETLKGLVEILKPVQAVHFLIAAAELHLKVHEFGKSKDAAAAAATARPDPIRKLASVPDARIVKPIEAVHHSPMATRHNRLHMSAGTRSSPSSTSTATAAAQLAAHVLSGSINNRTRLPLLYLFNRTVSPKPFRHRPPMSFLSDYGQPQNPAAASPRSVTYWFVSTSKSLDFESLHCGSCGYELNLSSSDRDTANIGSKYRKSAKKGIVSFVAVDESRFSQIEELRCWPYFESRHSWGLLRRKTKLSCRKCKNFVGVGHYDGASTLVGSDSSGNGEAPKKYFIKISALQPLACDE